MKPEAQRIAIAEACGLHVIMSVFGLVDQIGCLVPDYLNDLNAMHEAEKMTFNNSDLWISFIDCLCDATGAVNCSMVDALIITNHATAAQRAESFLRAIGKWVES
jgi:hypothetical protein